MKNRLVLTVLTVVALSLLVLASGSIPTPASADDGGQPKYGGTLVVTVTYNPSLLDPARHIQQPERAYLYALFNGLVKWNDQFEIVPDLAETIDLSDPTAWVFTLREGVKFHDGTDFNAEAVKAHFDRVRDPETRSPWADNFKSIREVVVIDEHTVRFDLHKPDAVMLHAMASGEGMIPSPTAIRELGDDFALHPVGTGPFVFVEWVQDSHVVVERNPNYFEEGLPYLDGMLMKVVPDGAVAATELRTGNAHVIHGASADQIPQLERDRNLTIVERVTTGWQYIQLNAGRAPFDDPRVRQAVCLALDTELMTQAVWDGRGVALHGPIAPGFAPYFQPEVLGSRQNLAEANRLLREAGLTSLNITWVGSSAPPASFVVPMVQAQLAQLDIPVTVNVNMQAGNAYLVEMREGRYDLGFRGQPPYADLGQTFGRVFYSTAGLNYGRYHNERVDELIELGEATLELEDRIPIYQEIQQIVLDEAPVCPLISPASFWAFSNEVKGMELVPDGLLRAARVWLDR